MKKLLIAHKHNNYRPHLLRGLGVTVTALFVVGLFFVTKPLGEWIARTDLGAALYPAVLTDLANQSRIQSNLGGLTINPLLVKAAELKAEDMAAKGYFAHNSPEGFLPWHWFTLAGYSYVYAGENLAIDFQESSDVETAWMNSPGHRANILNPNYTEVGIAMRTGMYQGHQTTFIVEMFGSPKNAPVVITPETEVAALKTAVKTQPIATAVKSEVKGESTEVKGTSTDTIMVDVTPRVYSNTFEKIITTPGKMTVLVYGLLTLAALISLLSLFVIEVGHRDTKHVIYGMVILVIILIFAYLEWTTVLSTVKIL